MATRARWTGTLLLVMGLGGAVSGAGKTAFADAPAAFGPVEGGSFHFVPGAKIERPTAAGCNNNADIFLIRGPNVANAKHVDVSPKTYIWEKQAFPTTDCVAPNCLQMFVRVTNKDAPGPRTVTLKHADGRTITTTFDVTENAGRCDYPQNKNK
ncbi:hypothetical protein AKJ09_00241 [Labilithrix luteola]|uniref:Lipoprotein n=1 Tax=Labilithrix luteola TaxID=1391654 RepID=A0A0K1PJ81_9BACT|nr:hypothetical protein [Labilithrix luteola]AKU93577.1 hypothetical protein AKJ09_00241 [Labilithrix luteola]